MGALTVELPEYPFWPNDVVSPDQPLLDDLAREYALGQDGTLGIERFLFGAVPVTAFDRIFRGRLNRAAAGGILWTYYLSGYFGGVWLRGSIDRAQKESRLAGIAIPPTREGFEASVAAAGTALDASGASDDDVIAYARRSLFPSGESTAMTDGLVENFGYNQGYLLEILEVPPDGLPTPPGYHIESRGPLACKYETPKLEVLRGLSSVEDALTAGSTAAYSELAAKIAPVQAAGVIKGRGVWSGGLSVQGFKPEEYEQLLDVSASYLEDVQATALATVKAVAEGDAQIGRRAAIANAAMGIWLTAYTSGLMEGRDAAELPHFRQT